MIIKRIREQKNRYLCRFLSAMLMVPLVGFASTAGATFSLPASRSVTWEGNVGVKGDIPSRTTIYKTLSPSGGDDTSAIQTAINNCPTGQVVKLNSGTFSVKSSIKMKSGSTVRGTGMGKTIIKGASGMSGSYVIGYDGYSVGSSVNISGGLKKGSTSITTASAHGWSAGDVILIDQLNKSSDDPPVTNVGNNGTATWAGRANGTRSLGQMVKVVSVPSSTTATLEIPLYWNFDSSLTPQATRITGMTKDAGIEDLTVNNSASGSSAQKGAGGTFKLNGASNCWLLRVEGIGAYESMVKLRAAYRNTIRGCKFHEGTPATPTNGASYGTDRAYGLYFNPYASANLIENNELYHLRLPILMSGAISGNVIGYNYIAELYMDSAGGNAQITAISPHGAHPIMNLIEGNYVSGGRLRSDNVWGSASHNTFFRNRATLDPNRSGLVWTCDLHKNSQYFNVVGNVLGTTGLETTYELNNISTSGKKSVFRFGYTGDGDKEASGNDSRVAATVLRHGNWDAATNGVVWNGSDDRSLPASLYLSTKPSWWGTVQWPAIGPDVSPKYPTAPGAGKGTPWKNTTVLSPPTNLTAK